MMRKLQRFLWKPGLGIALFESFTRVKRYHSLGLLRKPEDLIRLLQLADSEIQQAEQTLGEERVSAREVKDAIRISLREPDLAARVVRGVIPENMPDEEMERFLDRNDHRRKLHGLIQDLEACSTRSE